MALHFELKVNGSTIGTFVAQRRNEVIPASGICTYDVEINGEHLIVHHEYNNGAWSLVRAAISSYQRG